MEPYLKFRLSSKSAQVMLALKIWVGDVVVAADMPLFMIGR